MSVIKQFPIDFNYMATLSEKRYTSCHWVGILHFWTFYIPKGYIAKYAYQWQILTFFFP